VDFNRYILDGGWIMPESLEYQFMCKWKVLGDCWCVSVCRAPYLHVYSSC
jgi:hypothetical protein